MEGVKTLHMNGGDGETSYAKNSTVQGGIIKAARKAVEEAVLQLCPASSFPDKLSIADLGCASGPNTLSLLSSIVDIVTERCQELGRRQPELQCFLCDLPGNDFNSLFSSLQTFHEKRAAAVGGAGKEIGQCFIAGVPGSFYGRLFQSRSIHFFHSSSSLHWLSQAPPQLQQKGVFLNMGSIYITKDSPDVVVEAYLRQFEEDLTSFLRYRSEEMVGGGRMVLVLPGRKDSDPRSEEMTIYWALLSEVLLEMAREGYFTETLVDSFNVPCFYSCEAEVKSVIERQGSFALAYLETLEVQFLGTAAGSSGRTTSTQSSSSRSDLVRSIVNLARVTMEPILANHFGGHVIDDLFARYHRVLEGRHLPIEEDRMMATVAVSLVRLP